MSSAIAKSASDAYDKELKNWVDRERKAVELIGSIGALIFDKSVELVLFRDILIDKNVSQILKLHKYAREVVKKPISIHDTTEIAALLRNFDLAPSKIDLGKLAWEWQEERNRYESITDFLKDKLKLFMNEGDSQVEPRDVVLYGFGRIGRLAARELIKQAGKGQQLRLKAIVTRSISETELVKRADLLRMDSVHGPFDGTIDINTTNNTLVINGQIVNMIAAKNPEDVNYESYGITNAILIDNTGAFRDKEALSRHLNSKGIGKVLLTAPGKEVPNIVYGVNHKEFDREEYSIYSAASCTTNAIVPVLKVINDAFGVEKGHIETVHSYTNDQNLLDNFHKKFRRGRSAAINMVITETGAGKAVTKVIPELKDKLTANAVRVPTPNGSLAIMSLAIGKAVTVEEVNAAVREAALNGGTLANQIRFSTENELVSSDIIGDSCCSVFDSPATLVHPDKKNIVVYVWYDNEFGYTKQVIRLAKYVTRVARLLYY